MTKPSNWPHWRHLQVGSSHDSGAILVEFLVALAVTGLIVTILMSTSWLQLRAYQATMEQSEALQNAWAALLWLRRDLQAAREVTVAQHDGVVTLEVPHISAQDRTEVKWRSIEYRFQPSNAQLQRNIRGSYNIVAEGVIGFTFSLNSKQHLATITVTTREGSKTIQITTKIWLRNMR
ncbi:MAG: PulJ/GspJ family protein [bacterium]|jgi:Tfp pilus assembly protein PilX